MQILGIKDRTKFPINGSLKIKNTHGYKIGFCLSVYHPTRNACAQEASTDCMGMIRNPKEASKHGKKDVKLEITLL